MRDAGLTVLAVDDEQSQLEDLARLLRSSPTVEAVECAFDGHDALVKATVQQYDVIFLDVRMPDLDGVELGRVLRRFAVSPELVYVSAYDTAAADAFELHALDYLRKPVSRRRVEEALVRVSAARHEHADESPETAPVTPGTDGELIALASVRGGANRLVSRGEILYAQAHGDYVRIVTRDGRYLLRATLQELEQRWSQFGFERVHRQFLANLHRAVEVSPLLGGTAELRFTDQLKIPIARRHVGALLRRLGV
jgi:DNA-binding LytR/AlgR family response regulator